MDGAPEQRDRLATESLTRILTRVREGDLAASHVMWELVYEELHRMASQSLNRSPGARAGLRPTELVHEAYVKLERRGVVQWDNRAHFFSAAARAMRNVLVDQARSRIAKKNGGGSLRVTLSGLTTDANGRSSDAEVTLGPEALLDLEEAMLNLEQVDTRLADTVDLRYFGGLTIRETADALGVSTATVERDWQFAKAWLHRELWAESDDAEAPS